VGNGEGYPAPQTTRGLGEHRKPPPQRGSEPSPGENDFLLSERVGTPLGLSLQCLLKTNVVHGQPLIEKNGFAQWLLCMVNLLQLFYNKQIALNKFTRGRQSPEGYPCSRLWHQFLWDTDGLLMTDYLHPGKTIGRTKIQVTLCHSLRASGGFFSVELVNRINAFLRRMQRFGYLQCHITVAELMNKSDYDLFCKLCAPTHALNHLLPPTKNLASLRTRGHSYQLPEYSTDLHKKCFLICSLYSFVK